MTKHVIVLFDIDGTLSNLYREEKYSVVWNGGSSEIWKANCALLREEAKKKDIQIHFGIDTAKPKYANTARAELKKIGDSITDEVYRELSEFLNPNNLAFYTGLECKIKYGLELAKKEIEYKYKVSLKNSDAWIIDDRKESVCNPAIAKGFNAVSAEDISSQSISEQRTRINAIFKEIFTKLELSYAPPILSQIADRVTEPENVKNRLLQQSIFLSRPARFTAVPDGIKGLDEDEATSSCCLPKGSR